MANQKCNQPCWPGYRRVPGMGCGKGSCAKIGQTPKRRKRGSRTISRKGKSKKKRGSRKNSRKKKRGSRKSKSKKKRGSRKISRKGKSKKKRGSRKISRKISRSRQKYMANKDDNIGTTTNLTSQLTTAVATLTDQIRQLEYENERLRTQINTEKEKYDKEINNLLRKNYILNDELTALKATAEMRYQNLGGFGESSTDELLPAYPQQQDYQQQNYPTTTDQRLLDTLIKSASIQEILKDKDALNKLGGNARNLFNNTINYLNTDEGKNQQAAFLSSLKTLNSPRYMFRPMQAVLNLPNEYNRKLEIKEKRTAKEKERAKKRAAKEAKKKANSIQ